MNDLRRKRLRRTKALANNCLPPTLALFTDKDRSKFLSALDVDPNPRGKTYGKSPMCVHSVLVSSEDNTEKLFDL